MTNNLIIFGGSKDVAFNQEVSDLLGKTRVPRTSWSTGHRAGRSVSGDDIPVLTGSEIRQLGERHALVIAENGKPLIARLTRCIDGRPGKQLLADQAHLRNRLTQQRRNVVPSGARTTAALAEAHTRDLDPETSP